jgi:hypothetical protein
MVGVLSQGLRWAAWALGLKFKIPPFCWTFASDLFALQHLNLDQGFPAFSYFQSSTREAKDLPIAPFETTPMKLCPTSLCYQSGKQSTNTGKICSKQFPLTCLQIHNNVFDSSAAELRCLKG